MKLSFLIIRSSVAMAETGAETGAEAGAEAGVETGVETGAEAGAEAEVEHEDDDCLKCRDEKQLLMQVKACRASNDLALEKLRVCNLFDERLCKQPDLLRRHIEDTLNDADRIRIAWRDTMLTLKVMAGLSPQGGLVHAMIRTELCRTVTFERVHHALHRDAYSMWSRIETPIELLEFENNLTKRKLAARNAYNVARIYYGFEPSA